MLFVAISNAKAGSPKERIARRAHWQYPEGAKPVAEYWLQTSTPSVVSIFEAETIAPIMAATTEWGDVLDISVFPAITATDGLKLAKQMM
jgi:hypothetical protein